MIQPTLESDDPGEGFSKIGHTLEALLLEGKYVVLDASLARMQSTGKTLSDGTWAHDAAGAFLSRIDLECHRGVFSDLKQLFRPALADAPWLARLDSLRAWREACPRSITPFVCIANFYLGNAWSARGSSWANEVPDSACKKFFARVRLASDALKAVEARATECLAWFPISLIAVKAQEREVGEWYAVFERGARACPAYWNVYTVGADFHLERWSGSREQLADFLGRAVELSSECGGKSVAARIVWSLLDQYGDTVVGEIAEQDWGLIRAGFGDWLHANPSASVANYFLFASRCVEDKGTARRLLETISTMPYHAVWNTHLAEQFGGFRGVCAWAKN